MYKTDAEVVKILLGSNSRTEIVNTITEVTERLELIRGQQKVTETQQEFFKFKAEISRLKYYQQKLNQRLNKVTNRREYNSRTSADRKAHKRLLKSVIEHRVIQNICAYFEQLLEDEKKVIKTPMKQLEEGIEAYKKATKVPLRVEDQEFARRIQEKLNKGMTMKNALEEIKKENTKIVYSMPISSDTRVNNPDMGNLKELKFDVLEEESQTKDNPVKE